MNTIDISYDKEEFKIIAPEDKVYNYLQLLCKKLELENVEFSVSFVDQQRIHSLNKEYRNIDAPTDILSFVQSDTNGDMLPNEDFPTEIGLEHEKLLGDMLICLDVMKINSDYFNVEESEELQRLLIHGLLHLTGWDHETNDSDEPMIVRQENILEDMRGKF